LVMFFQAIFPQSYAGSFEKKLLLQRPDTAAIEENLLKFLNEDRKKQNLPLLTLSSNLNLDEIQSKNYESAGLGVNFSRSQKYPGGAYFITLILLIENRYKYLNTEELRKLEGA